MYLLDSEVHYKNKYPYTQNIFYRIIIYLLNA